LEDGGVIPAAEAAPTAPRRSRPWLERQSEQRGLGPIAPGAAIALGLAASFAAGELILGPERFASLPQGELRDIRLALLHFALSGWAVTAYLSVVRGSRRRVDALRAWLPADDAEARRLADGAGAYPATLLRVAGLLGVAASLVIPLLAQGGEDVYRPSTWGFEVVWHRLLAPFVGWWMGRFVFAVLAESDRFSRLAGRLRSLDLLDLRPSEVFARQGLAHALLTAGFVSLFALFLFESGFGAMFAVVGMANLGLSAAGLLLPVIGMRRRIRAAKRAELDELRERLLRARAELRAGGARDGRVADLLAYRGFVEGVREWPFDATALARFGLYLLIPLGSWLGGALVERAVDRLFD
jgi:hypothetical protein